MTPLVDRAIARNACRYFSASQFAELGLVGRGEVAQAGPSTARAPAREPSTALARRRLRPYPRRAARQHPAATAAWMTLIPRRSCGAAGPRKMTWLGSRAIPRRSSAAAAAPPPACARGEVLAGGGRVWLRGVWASTARLGRAVQAALHLVEQRPCLGYQLCHRRQGRDCPGPECPPARAPALRPPCGSGAGRACSRAPRPTAAQPAVRQRSPSPSVRIANAIARTEWVLTTT